jgi:hypothetical protein
MSKTKRGSNALKRAAMREQSRGKVAVCPDCNTWFGSWQERNDHRAKCPKRRKA